MLMADDMMDGSVTRRGNPCWYRRVVCRNLGLVGGFEEFETLKSSFSGC